MNYIEIRSSLNSNASISPSSVIVDTSDYQATGKAKFETSIIIDVIKTEIQEHNLELPRKFEAADTSKYVLPPEILGSGGFYSFSNDLNIYHLKINYIRLGKCGHPSTGWLSRDDNVVYFCDKVFCNETDLRYLMYSFDTAETYLAATKDKCLGFALAGLGAISATYKRAWAEITPNFLETVQF